MVTLILLAALLVPFLLIGGVWALVQKRKRRTILRRSAISYLITASAVLLGAGPWLAAWGLTHAHSRPQDRILTASPADYGAPYEDISFDSSDSVRLSGWFMPPAGTNAVVIGTHGLFRNRVEMLARTIPLVRYGYGALLYDSRSHGKSAKAVVSLGYHERRDVLGAIQYVRLRYRDSAQPPRIILMGVSMGALAVLEAAAESKGYSALILDSPFSSLRETVADHCWLYLKLPRYPFSALVLFWIGQMAGFDPVLLDAHRALARIEPVPLLIITSNGDRRISSEHGRALYDESKAALKRLEVFDGNVTHGAAARLQPEKYDALLKSFLAAALGETG